MGEVLNIGCHLGGQLDQPPIEKLLSSIPPGNDIF